MSAPRVLLLALLSWAGQAVAQDASDWLARMGRALSGLDYQGTLVYVSGARVETLRVYHAADGRERLVTLSGKPREIVRDGARVTCIGTAPTPMIYDGELPGRWSAALAAARAAGLVNYVAVLGDRARVAGLDAQVLDLRADDAYRYGYRLWLERDSGLPLRIALIDSGPDGARVAFAREPIEQIAFTQVEIGRRPAAADLRPSTLENARRLSLPSPSTEPVPWDVTDPPPGFALRASHRTPQGVQLVYSDGVASVSIYIEPAAGQRGVALTRVGAVNGYARPLGEQRVFAIGKVPAATVRHFARNVRASVEAGGG